ncbi:hypothetical protein FRB91_004488 [Serendipita sp. 411]|nr:hypothetical protein FRB91_004488 [Serendipita sp. 411]
MRSLRRIFDKSACDENDNTVALELVPANLSNALGIMSYGRLGAPPGVRSIRGTSTNRNSRTFASRFSSPF